MKLVAALRVMLVAWALAAASAFAATCAPAGAPGAAPPSWDTYCWLDMSSYVDATALSAGGQAMSFNLSDGSTLSFTISTSSNAASGVAAVAAPSWTGGAVGNTSFLNIPGRPILYTINGGSLVTLTLSNIRITPPAGAIAGSYMFIVADGESTNSAESLTYTTNGGNWTLLDQVAPISGTLYPTYAIAGQTATVTGVPGTVGAQIFGSVTPTTVTARLQAGGLQGVMFAVRFATVRLTSQLNGARVSPSDQFAYAIRSTSSGNTLSSNQTSGATGAPGPNAITPMASGIAITLAQAMATGSGNPLSAYRTTLSCTNASTGSTTPLPNNVVSQSYSFGSVSYGDNISCVFTNIAFPRVNLQKAFGGPRVLPGDQATVQILNGATVVASATTTGTGATIATGATGLTQLTAGTAYTLTEQAAGTTNLAYYTAALACTNAWSASTTALPTAVGATITPQLGDVVTCTITNSPRGGILQVVKTSAIVSDPISGTSNPKLIPGAIVRYTLTVTSIGAGPIDASSIVLTDVMPAQMATQVTAAPAFADGSPSSTLSLPASGISWSKTAGGGAPFTATLSPDAQGYDSAVTGLRLQPTGTMPGATAGGQPSFTISFLARVK